MWVKDEFGNWMLDNVVLGSNEIITPEKTTRIISIVKTTDEENRLKYFKSLDK